MNDALTPVELAVEPDAWQRRAWETAFALQEFWEDLNETQRDLVAAIHMLPMDQIAVEQSADLVMAWAEVAGGRL